MTKPRLLICTIMRNQRANVNGWAQQLADLRTALGQSYSITVSVYENDSTDGTAQWLRVQRDAGRLWAHLLGTQTSSVLTTDTLGTNQYGSVWSIDRIRNLATARNKCLEQVGDLSCFTKIAYIEPDVTYDSAWAAELVLARHPKAAGLGDPDIYSGWSLRSARHPKESTFLYDTCATRATSTDVCWDVNENGGNWRGQSLVRTDLGGVDSNCLHRVWSTFNCFCVYNAKPFIDGVRWEYVNRYNRHINPSNIWVDDGDIGSGWLDADTAVLCEAFRDRGYNGVYLNTNVLIRHS